jgi:AraC family transcriptional regulator
MKNMEPTIQTIPPQQLIGMHLKMTLAQNRTGELWHSFMPRRKEIAHPLSSDLISMQVYPEPMRPGDPTQAFEKWAAVPVKGTTEVPAGMESFTLPGGLYAVFHYIGSSADIGIFQYIFGAWLPSSPYQLDTRPQFEVLGEKYGNMDPESEEDIWIPIKK